MKKISLSVKGFFKLASALFSELLFSMEMPWQKTYPSGCPLRLNQTASLLLCSPYDEHRSAYRAGLVL